jgi:hypothetical protein
MLGIQTEQLMAAPILRVEEEAAKEQEPTAQIAAVVAPLVMADAVLPASPLPAPAAAQIEAQVREEEIVMVLGDRRYRIRGLAKNLAFDVLMKVNVLINRGYVLVHRGGRGQSFVYELLYDGRGQDGKPFLMGLVDVESLRCAYDGKKEHRNPHLEQSSSPQRASLEHGSSEPKSSPNTLNHSTSREIPKKNGKLASRDENASISSYQHPPLAAAGLQ